MMSENNTALIELQEFNRKTFRLQLDLGFNSTSSLASAFFNDDRGITTHQRHHLLPPKSVTLGESLVVYKNAKDFTEIFNQERKVGLQPNFVPDSQQGLLRYLKVLITHLVLSVTSFSGQCLLVPMATWSFLSNVPDQMSFRDPGFEIMRAKWQKLVNLSWI